MTIKGNYFTPGRSAPFEATLHVGNSGSQTVQIELTDGSAMAAEIKSISDRLGNTERRLEFEDGSAFLTFDNDGIDRIAFGRRGWFSNVSRLEGFHPRLLGFVILCVLLIAGFIRFGIPAAAKAAAWATPPGIAKIIDDSSLASMDRLLLKETGITPNRQAALQDNFSDLVAAHGEPIQTRLIFRSAPSIGPNAFALPGGTIMVTDQMIRLANNDEITAVLAHELAHVDHQHGLQQMYRVFGFAALVSLFTGDIGGIGEEVIGGGGLLLAMAASREMELEADREAVELLKKAGRDPVALKTALNKLHDVICKKQPQACKEIGWFSSHPGGEERDKALDDAISAQ